MSKSINYAHLAEGGYITAGVTNVADKGCEYVLNKEKIAELALMDFAAEVLENPSLQVVMVGNENSCGYALLGDILEVETDAD